MEIFKLYHILSGYDILTVRQNYYKIESYDIETDGYYVVKGWG